MVRIHNDEEDPQVEAAFRAEAAAFIRGMIEVYADMGQPRLQARESAFLVARELFRRTLAAHRGEGAALDLEALFNLPLRGTSEGTAGTAVGVA